MSLTIEQKQAALNKPLVAPLSSEEGEYVVGLLQRQMTIHAYVMALQYWVDADKHKARRLLETFLDTDGAWKENLPYPLANEWQQPQ